MIWREKLQLMGKTRQNAESKQTLDLTGKMLDEIELNGGKNS